MDIQPLIGEVVKKHRVILDENDPIFVTVTLNELLLKEYINRIQEFVNQSQTQVSIATTQQIEAMKKLASQLVTGAGVYVTDQFKAASDTFRAQIEQDIAEQRKVRDEIIQHQNATFWCAIISALAMGATIGFGFLFSFLH